MTLRRITPHPIEKSRLGFVGQHAIDRRARYPKCGGDGGCRFAIGMHPTSQGCLRFAKCLRAANRLPTRTTCFPRRFAPFAPKFEFKFSKASQHARHHSPSRVRCVDAFPQGPQHDAALAKFVALNVPVMRSHFFSFEAMAKMDPTAGWMLE